MFFFSERVQNPQNPTDSNEKFWKSKNFESLAPVAAEALSTHGHGQNSIFSIVHNFGVAFERHTHETLLKTFYQIRF